MNDVVGFDLMKQMIIHNELMEEHNNLLKRILEKLGDDEE